MGLDQVRFIVDSDAIYHLIRDKYRKYLMNEKKITQEVNVAKRGDNLKLIKLDLSLTTDTNRMIKITNVCKVGKVESECRIWSFKNLNRMR